MTDKDHGREGKCWKDAQICDVCWHERWEMVRRQGNDSGRRDAADEMMERAKEYWAAGETEKAELLREESARLKA